MHNSVLSVHLLPALALLVEITAGPADISGEAVIIAGPAALAGSTPPSDGQGPEGGAGGTVGALG